MSKPKLANRMCAMAMLAAMTGLMSACSGNSNDPTTYPVTGRVTFDGRPVAGALVVFRPKASRSVAAVQTTSGEDGTFDVHIFLDMGKRTKRGMVPEDYQIEVTQLVNSSGPASIVKPPENVLPKKYASIQTSGLEATVSAEGKNDILLELSKK